MTRSLDRAMWPVERAGEALEALARRFALTARTSGALPRPHPPSELRAWIDAVARHLGVDAEPVHAPHRHVTTMLRGIAPALLLLETKGERGLLAITRSGRDCLTVLGPDLRTMKVPLADVRAALCQPLEAPLAGDVGEVLDAAGIAAERRHEASEILAGEWLADVEVGGCWILRPSPAASFWRQVRFARLLRYVAALAAGHVAQYGLSLLAWWAIGLSALEGRLGRDALVTWGLLLFTAVPFQLLETWAHGRFALGTGRLLKQRLLAGALRIDPAETRREGAGQLLGRVIDSEAVESLATHAGPAVVLGVLELPVAVAIFAAIPVGWPLAVALVCWVGGLAALAWRVLLRRAAWTRSRVEMTNDLVENMVGQRTRILQQEPERWHDHEDMGLADYVRRSEAMDRVHVWLGALSVRGWLFVGTLGLVPSLVWDHPSPGVLAVAIGGLLVAARAIAKLVSGWELVSDAAIAWHRVGPLVRAAADAPAPGIAGTGWSVETPPSGSLLDARRLTFRHPGRAQPILRGCSLRIDAGDAVLLEGRSGSGKSTLAALIAGLRRPDAGLLLLRGLDREALGEHGWRRRVACAPQFHENHVLTGSLAFNLLMGRDWPPTSEDLDAAERICRELGLGPLLDRMPRGLFELVGDQGWQLSHGERSRLYLARALLQGGDVVVLDETFGTLDPENLQSAVDTTLRRSRSVLAIAHP